MIHPLKMRRLERELSQYDIAYQTGIPQVKLSYAERGYPSLTEKQRLKLAEFFVVSVEELFPDVVGAENE